LSSHGHFPFQTTIFEPVYAKFVINWVDIKTNTKKTCVEKSLDNVLKIWKFNHNFRLNNEHKWKGGEGRDLSYMIV
jgi:hypothetical protein